MVHPVKTPLGAVRAVTNASFHVVRHPLRTAEDAAAMGRGLVATVVTGIRPGHAPVVVDMDDVGEPVAQPAPTDERSTLKRQGDPVSRAADDAAPATSPAAAQSAPAAGDAAAPLPADAATTTAEPAEPRDEVATEPSSVTAVGDDEEIPSSAVPFEDEDVEVTTPVGTTGAGPGYNPDTNETDLQQPGTEPLMDPSLTKSIKSEAETLQKAAEPDKD
jgi:hypothetical protein